MKWLKKIKGSTAAADSKLQGLAVSIDELIEQQKYLPYLLRRKNKFTSNRAGDVKSAFKGRGMELEEVRSYNFGDDVRDIDWRVTARKDEPYTKIFSEEKDREILVFLDMSASMVFGSRHELKTVTAAKIAALIGWLTIKNKDRFGLLLYDGAKTAYFKPQNDTVNLINILNRISLKTKEILEEGVYGDIGQALDVLQYHRKNCGSIFILSDFHDFDLEKFGKIAVLAGRQQVYCINIFDVLEEVAPVSGTYAAQYGNEKVVFDTYGERFKRLYRRHFEENRLKLKRNCQKFSCKYMEIRTDVPIIKQLSL